MQKLKKPISILLVFMMIVSLFAAVPMTVNAAPPGGTGGGITVDPIAVTTGSEFATAPTAINGLVANGTEQALINEGTTSAGTAYYYMTTEDITGEQANSLFNSPSKPGSFSTSIPKGTDAGTYYVWYAIDGGSNYEDLLPYMEINNEYESHKLTVTIAAPTTAGDDYLTFTAEEAGSSVTLKVPTGNSFQYDLNGTGLTDYTLGTEITLANVGDFVRFRGRNTAFSASNHVSITGKVACSGNVMSLRLDEDGRDQGLSYGCFNYMFEGCTGLTAAPELPETTLASHCYECMFFGCTNLTAAPELPATALATGCYSSMFAGCTSLTTAPELWATTLATGCYERMFYACRSLTTAPELPATTLARNCYSYMFAGCERLTTAPELPATELVSNCYSRMFYRCSNIKLSETQTAEYSIPYRVPSVENGTTATDALNNMFYGTGGTFAGTPEINKTYYLYREVPKYTVTWQNEDGTTLKTDKVEEDTTPTYDGATPTKAADGDHMYVFSGWTPELAPVTEDVTYTATFASSADLVEITDHETDLGDLGLDYDMSEWGRSMTAQEAITLAQYMSAQNDGAKCAVLYDVVDGYDLQYAMSDGTTGSYTDFYGYTLNDFLPDYKVYYLPVNLNPQTIELNLNPDNATVIWYDATDSAGNWSMEAAYNDSCYLVLKGDSNQPAGTYDWADMGSGCGITDYDASQDINFVDGSCTVTVDEDVVTVSGTFTGRDRNTYVITVTYEAPYYTITAESVNGAVTAGVNGADVTKAKAGKTVLLNVAPADGYQLKSITASAQKTIPEDFSDLVALMGDAVFDGDENYDCGGYTCKVENGKFVVYNGTTLVAELSESNKTGFNSDSDYVEVNTEDALWAFYVKNGEITGIDVSDTNDDYIFCSLSGSKSTGTLQPVQVDLTTVAEGSQYSFTMPAKNVTVKAEFEAIPAPAPAKLILNVGENGKVVMNNGTFGNATDASNISEIRGSVNVADGYNASIANVSIVDGHSVNLVEGGSINIATGGEVSFYPSADNTGKITAIPAEGYICTGWYNGDTRYTTKDTIDYQEISEDMTLTAKFAPDLFPQHSITLGGNIGVNFYIDSAAADFAHAGSAVVKFTWDGGGEDRTKEVNLKELTTDGDGYYKATVDVVAAQMAHKIHAEVYLNGEKLDQTDDYSVQDYAETVYANPAEYDSAKPNELKSLVLSLLNYGAMAQTVFDSALNEKPALANATVGDNGYEYVTADMIAAAINGTASDLNAIAEQLGAKYYTNSLIYLSKNTLRIYFTPTSYPGEIPNAGAYDGNLSGYYYYVDHENIPAAELDNQQTFTVGGTTFTFSALDYAKAVVESTKMEPEQKNLAKSLYLYNMTANDYFDVAHDHTPGEPVHVSGTPATCSAAGSYYEVTYCTKCGEEVSRVAKTIDKLAHTIVAVAEVPATTEADGVAAHYECSVCHKLFSDAEGNNETTAEALVIPQIVENVVDLSTLTKGYEAKDGDVLINALKGLKYIRIADGATIKLRNANITSLSNSSGVKIAGLTLLGDATIILEGTNTIRGGYEYCPGIHVPEGKTLTIDGTGSLDVSSNGRGFACGIGSNDGTNCGNIVINGGNITAYAGTAAGIGAKSGSSCGTITINGGTVNATSGDYGAGIGSTLYGNSICGDITINGGIVNATAKYQGAGIGSGVSANCGNITITGGIVTAIGGVNGAGIGSGEQVSICGNILITGGTVTAKGGENAAGIGSGYKNSSCGTITITDTVTQVTATKGSNASNSIGAGSNGSTCGTVTIEDGANVTQN